jgi:hypothetical protein
LDPVGLSVEALFDPWLADGGDRSLQTTAQRCGR